MSFIGNLSSPAGMAITGIGQAFGSNLRRKRALRANQGVSQQQGQAIYDFYNGAIPYATNSAQNYADATRSLAGSANNFFAGMGTAPMGGAPTIDPSAWLSANPEPTAPTLREPSAIKFDPMLPRGARDAIRGKLGKKNDRLSSEYDKAVADWTTQRDAVTQAAADQKAAAEAAAAEQTNYGDKVLKAYQDRASSMDAENKAALDSITGGYQDRYTRNMADLKGDGEQAAKDINTAYSRNAGAITADARNRGISNTTVLSNLQQGNEQGRVSEQGRLSDKLRQERIGLDTALSEDTLKAKTDLTKFGQQQKLQLTGDTIMNMDSQRREALGTMLQQGALANEADRQVAATKLGVSTDFLNNVLDWYNAQMQPVGEYSSVLGSLGPAQAAWQQREAQRAAARAAQNQMWTGLGMTALTGGLNLAIPFAYGAAGAYGGAGGYGYGNSASYNPGAFNGYGRVVPYG